MKKQIKEKHTHHHWHGADIFMKQLFFALIIFLLITTGLTILRNEQSKNQDMYNSCLNTCKAKPVYWNQNPEIINYDFNKVECVRVCNSFYYIRYSLEK